MSVGERIRQARKMAQMSQDALGNKAGVSKQAISKYELAKDMPGSAVLSQLAKALGVRVEFFLRRKSALDVQAPAYRRHSRLGAKEQEAILAEVQEWLERYLEVESFLPRDEVRSFQFPPNLDRNVHCLEVVEDVAEGVRRAWDLGLDPIENLTEVLEDKGIKVRLAEAPDRFDALTMWVNGEVPVIAVNRSFPGDRQRFSLAHELGHLMLKVGPGVDEERAACRFAGAFLVPAAVAHYELGGGRHTLDAHELYLLKQKYGVSMQAWVYRAKDLGIVSESAAQSLFSSFKSSGWYRQEPGEQLPREEPQRMKRLVMKLLAEDLISESRAAELLGEPLRRFRDEMVRKYEGRTVAAGD